MTFPAIDISVNKWNLEDLMEYIIYNDYIYTRKDSVFKKYYKNHLFCDSRGKIYKAIKKAEMTASWRNWFQFIPYVWKTKIIFENTNEMMSLDELKEYLIERISDLDDGKKNEEWKANSKQHKILSKWKDDVLKAKNHEDLILNQ